MNVFTKHHIGLALWLALLSPVAAQTLAPVQCRFVALNETPPPFLNIAGDDKEALVKIFQHRITDPVECFSVDGKLTFIDQTNHTPLASISLPSSIKKATLIFVNTSPKSGQTWKIFPIEDTPQKFPAGGTHVVNLHNDDIRFILGETQKSLKPQQSEGFEMPEKRDDFNMAPVVFQFKNKSDKWVNGKETSYRFLPGLRYLLIAYIDTRNNRPRVATFKDPIRPVIPTR